MFLSTIIIIYTDIWVHAREYVMAQFKNWPVLKPAACFEMGHFEAGQLDLLIEFYLAHFEASLRICCIGG